MQYRYQNVCLESIAYTLPEETVSSAQIEDLLASLYRRLRLPEGRLELMSGIAQRRFWPQGTPPGRISAATGEKACAPRRSTANASALVHGSVCRDFLEPATACGVHHELDLPADCAVYDLSNACLGLLNGVVQVANTIELGQIEAGLIVGTESSRDLVESTIRRLNTDDSLSRDQIKPAFASLTIGSGSAAIVLADRRLSRSGNRLLGGVVRAYSQQCHLCEGGHEQAADGDLQTLMWTDSEALLHAGIAAAREGFAEFLAALAWRPGDIDRAFCHQVGRAHRKMLLDALGLDPAVDFSTFESLGNTGSVALPMTAAMGIERGLVRPGDRVAMLGIGSGINVIALGIQWAES